MISSILLIQILYLYPQKNIEKQSQNTQRNLHLIFFVSVNQSYYDSEQSTKKFRFI